MCHGIWIHGKCHEVLQILGVDLMFIKKVVFIVGVLNPLNLAMVKHLKDRTTSAISQAMTSFIGMAKSRSFEVKVVRSDGEGGVESCRKHLEDAGVQLEIAGPGQHVPAIERKLQTIKERVRMYDSGLPYVMSKLLLILCVYFCVSRLNFQPTRTTTDKTSPYEQFTGRKLDAKIDLRVNFGDYVQATEPTTDNTMSARTKGCVAGFPTGNLTGSVRMLCLSTNKVITRDQFRVLPTPTLVLDYITKLAAGEGYTRGMDPTVGLPEDDPRTLEELAALPEMTQIYEQPMERQAYDDRVDGGDDQVVVSEMPSQGVNEREPQAAEPQTEVWSEEPRQNSLPTQEDDITTAPVAQHTRRSERVKTVPKHLDDYTFAAVTEPDDVSRVFNISVHKALTTRRSEAEPVIEGELRQMMTKRVWHGLQRKDHTYSEVNAVIRSSMFL